MHDAIRPAAVAGSFYPSEPSLLSQMVSDLLHHQEHTQSLIFKKIKALIVPHAGYIYSGAIAASAYSLLTHLPQDTRRVLLLGPSHHVAFKGFAASPCEAFATPLGAVKLDVAATQTLLARPHSQYLARAHRLEHCLEVQLPFLQTILEDFLLVPLIVGHAQPDEVASIIEHFASMPHTLVIVSSDLSHFHPYAQAVTIDARTNHNILRLEGALVGEQACGCYPLNGLLHWARQRPLNIAQLALKNSGDTGGAKDSVVGYASYVLYE